MWTFDSSNFEDLQKEVNALKAEMTELSRQFTVAKDKLRSKMVEGQEKAPIHDENGNDLPLHGILEGLGLSTLVEVEEAHEEAQAVAAEIHDNPEALAKYNQQKDEIEDLSVRLDEAKKHKGVKLNNIKAKRQPWEASLQKTVDKINALFSNYMTDMGNSGEICLRKGEEGEGEYEGLANFSDWGIDIKVSFRGDQKTQVLSAMVQSGGERSVSTIMYLMALQDMMVSPFRCVDEINQGLDDRNERLVFKRIVKNSTSPPKSFPQNHTGQYFLITPKLLPNLTDMEEEAMTILFVMNGAFNFKDPEEWNVEDIIAAAGKAIHRKRQKVVGELDDEENSFNSLPRRIGKKSKPSPKN
jgi:chromosome segregation ATPase